MVDEVGNLGHDGGEGQEICAASADSSLALLANFDYVQVCEIAHAICTSLRNLATPGLLSAAIHRQNQRIP